MHFPPKGRPAYNTIQTMVYRMEPKGVVRRIKKVGNFHIFAASISREAAQRRLIDELLALFGGQSQPVVAHLVQIGKLSLNDVKEAEKALRKLPDRRSAHDPSILERIVDRSRRQSSLAVNHRSRHCVGADAGAQEESRTNAILDLDDRIGQISISVLAADDCGGVIAVAGCDINRREACSCKCHGTDGAAIPAGAGF